METTRLFIREYREEDAESVHEYCSDSHVLKYMLWGPNSLMETREFIEMALKESTERPRKVYNLAIEQKETRRLIGGISLILHHDEAEIGWILNNKAWKQGFGTEAAQAMIHFGFEDLMLDRIFATCDAENEGSTRIMMKCGLTQCAYQIKARLSPHLKTLRDQRLFEINKESYFINQINAKHV